MTEADLEYLIRTLSDAQSRATEISVAVGAQAGADDRLTDLGRSAVSNIEKLLRGVRLFALDEPQVGAPLKEDFAPRPTPQTVRTAPFRLPAIAPSFESDHWLPAYVDDLIARLLSPEGVSFETAECLLHDYKQVFLNDLETARRMYRTYPHLFETESPRAAGA